MAVVSDDPIETLQSLEHGDRLRFVANQTTMEAEVRRIYRGDAIIWLVVSTPDHRIFKIETQWANGWLEPLVDEYRGLHDELVPVGCLGEVSSVTPSIETDERADTTS